MFLQSASGQFSVEVGGEYHCGPDHTSPKTFEYEVSIQYDDSALDEHGFLLDNQTFAQYFNSIGYTMNSCELLVKRAGDAFAEATRGLALEVRTAVRVPGLAKVEYVTGSRVGLTDRLEKAMRVTPWVEAAHTLAKLIGI